MKAAVVGHVEWVQFMRVAVLPGAGDIVHADDWWEEPAGGGPVAAEQLRKLGASTTFFTALGDDEFGRAAFEDLALRGLRIETAWRNEPTRRAVTHVDGAGERTITVLGERLAPSSDDPLPWDLLEEMDAIYFTAGDPGALRHARRAAVLVATARSLPVLRAVKDVQLDALVGSVVDPAEAFAPDDVQPPPRLAVWTDGTRGGRFRDSTGRSGPYAPQPLSAPVVDRYGAGDSFAAGLTYALGAGRRTSPALELAARCGAAAISGRGAYAGQLSGSGIAEEAREFHRD